MENLLLERIFPKFDVAYPELQMSKNIYVKIRGNEDILLKEWKKL